MIRTLTIQFDHEDCAADYNMYIHVMDMYLAIDKARNKIREVLKYGDPEKDPELVLEELQEILYVPGLE